MRLISAHLTDVGLHREKNEDNYLDELGLYAVADGMGGHLAGEVASRIAVETIRQSRTWATIAGPDDPGGLRRVFKRAHRAIMDEASRDRAKRGMGTTLTAVQILDGGLTHVAHVGDSSCVLVRDRRATALTRPHTMVGLGYTRPEDADERARNALMNCLGAEEGMHAMTDVCELQLCPNDFVILASDGLTNYASPERIAEIVERSRDDAWREPGESTAQVICRNLVQHALGAGGHDNVTVVVVEVLR